MTSRLLSYLIALTLMFVQESLSARQLQYALETRVVTRSRTFVTSLGLVAANADAAPAAGISIGDGTLETLLFDTHDSSNDGTVGPVSSTIILGPADTYRVTISGTWSPWSADRWSSVCKGTPEDGPTTPSPGIHNGKVGYDAEFIFAAPAGSSPCSIPGNPPFPAVLSLEVSLDNGVRWSRLASADSGYDIGHTYTYSFAGQGFPIRFRLIDAPTDDNYGILTIRTEQLPDTYGVSGSVTNGTSQPLSGVVVSDGAGHAATTDTGGNYTLVGLPAGAHTITPSKPGYTFFSRTVSVPPTASAVNFATWDCGLAGIPQYYQGWPSTPDSRPNKPPWYDNAYGNPANYPDTDRENTVGKWGCNLTCASMMISYFGRNALKPFETDPGRLNTWLRAYGGYDSENGVIYAKATDYAWRNGVSLLLDGIGGRNDQKLEQHLCSGNPAMMRVATAYGPHYVLATGRTTLDGQTTYTINDPIWGQTTLRDYYNNNYQAAYYYRRGPGIYRASAIQFNVHSPVHLLVTDPLGRRSGYDPRTGTSWDEVPGAGYVTEIITAPDGTSLPERKVFVVSQPLGGRYNLDVIGYADGAYKIDAFLTDLGGDTRFESFSGIAAQGSVDHLPVTYVPSRMYLPMLRVRD